MDLYLSTGLTIRLASDGVVLVVHVGGVLVVGVMLVVGGVLVVGVVLVVGGVLVVGVMLVIGVVFGTVGFFASLRAARLFSLSIYAYINQKQPCYNNS